MTVYVVAQLRFTNVERYRKYQARFWSVFQKSKGMLLAADEAPQIMEGETPVDKIVLMSFPTKEDAIALMRDPDYQEISKDRKAGAVTVSHLFAGLEVGE